MITYVNERTGMVLTVDGPVLTLTEPGQKPVRMGFGDATYAARLGERIAAQMRLTESREEAA